MTNRLEVYKQCTFCNINVLVINYSSDTRYSDTMLSTHDEQMIPCIKTESIQDILDNHDITDVEVFLINEGQFFKDIELVKYLIDHNLILVTVYHY